MATEKITGNAPGTNAPAPTSAKPGDVVGASGTVIFNGFIVREEYNNDLKGRQGLDVYDKMRKSDATVRAALQVVKLPILAANWRTDAFSTQPKDMLINDFVHHNLFDIFSWDDVLRQILTFLDFGFSVQEIVWDMVQFKGKNYVGLQQLASRKQNTIWQWALDDGTFGVKQFVPGGLDGGFKQIPGDKVLIFSNDREGDNYFGVSILRPAYKHWYFKDALYKINAIAAERNGVGMPIITVPAGAKEPDKDTIRAIAANSRANELGFVEVPEGFTFEYADFKSRGRIDLMPDINHHDRQIMKTVLAQFLELGSQDASGSYSLSTDQSRLFMQSIQWVAKYVAEIINNELIPKLVDLNFTGVKGYPSLQFEKIGDDNLAELADALPGLVAAGFITPTPEDEEHLRKMANLPDVEISGANDEEQDNTPSTPADTEPPANPKDDTGTGTKTTANHRERAKVLDKILTADDVKRGSLKPHLAKKASAKNAKRRSKSR